MQTDKRTHGGSHSPTYTLFFTHPHVHSFTNYKPTWTKRMQTSIIILPLSRLTKTHKQRPTWADTQSKETNIQTNTENKEQTSTHTQMPPYLVLPTFTLYKLHFFFSLNIPPSYIYISIVLSLLFCLFSKRTQKQLKTAKRTKENELPTHAARWPCLATAMCSRGGARQSLLFGTQCPWETCSP